MKRSSLMIAVALLAAGCGGGRGATPASPAEAPAPAPPAAVDWERAQKLEVVLDDFSFNPSQVVLRANQPYVLQLRNASGTRHTFTAPEFFRTAALGPGPESAQIRDAGGTVSVAAGQSAEIDVLPLRSGTYPLSCDRPLHSVFGMTGTVVVK
ncbi:MAG: cupredoxin domain-containing protein [Rhodospirillales bacterium]|nr:cupredoxin domain-containing protein [Rhodospirillales bacterium]